VGDEHTVDALFQSAGIARSASKGSVAPVDFLESQTFIDRDHEAVRLFAGMFRGHLGGHLKTGHSSRMFWMRRVCRAISPTSCLRVRARSRSAWIGAGGTKLPRIKPWARDARCASRRSCRSSGPERSECAGVGKTEVN
jgi:hypothetical protein